MKKFFFLFVFTITCVLSESVYAQVIYNESETTKLRNFLLQDSAEPGVKNYQQLGISQINNINWASVPGLSWNRQTYLLESLSWRNKKLAGDLNLSDFEALEIVYCENNDLSSINLTGSTSIIYLDCYENNLYTLDVSTNVNLTQLCFRYNNLKKVDLSNNTKLTFLCCTGNQLESLDLSGLNKLATLYCVGNKLTELNIKDCVQLKELLCMDNNLTTLNLSNKAYLWDFSCARNNISDLKVDNCRYMVSIDCSNNELQTIDFSGCSELKYIKCIDNLLESIKIDDCLSLEELYCTNNLLNLLKMPVSPSLKIVHCKNNNMDFYTLPKITSENIDFIYYPQNSRSIEADLHYVDLSSYYEIEGFVSRYLWNEYLTLVRPEILENGIFRFEDSFVNKQLICRIENMSFPKLVLRYDVTLTDKVANENVGKNPFSAYASEGYIHITADSPVNVKIYSLNGALLMTKNVEVGRTDIPVERGMYVVSMNNNKGRALVVR